MPSGRTRSASIDWLCQRVSRSTLPAAPLALPASSRPRSSAGAAQSSTTVSRRGTGQTAAAAHTAAPVPPPTSTCVAGDQPPASASNRDSTDFTAPKVAGIRYAEYASTSARLRSTGRSVGIVPR